MEQIGLLALFALVGLFQWLVRWLRQRAAAAAADTAAAAPPPPAAPRATPMPAIEELIIHAPEPARAVAPRPRGEMSSRRAGPRRHARTVLSTRSELRRAIVLREILGPCRGMEPPNGSPARSTGTRPG